MEDVVVSAGAKVRNAIIDKGVVVPEGATLGYDSEKDLERGFTVTDSGIVALAKRQEFPV